MCFARRGVAVLSAVELVAVVIDDASVSFYLITENTSCTKVTNIHTDNKFTAKVRELKTPREMKSSTCFTWITTASCLQPQ